MEGGVKLLLILTPLRECVCDLVEGNVFYSDQRYTADEEDNPAVGHVAERKFAEFIRTFRSEEDEFIYRYVRSAVPLFQTQPATIYSLLLSVFLSNLQ